MSPLTAIDANDATAVASEPDSLFSALGDRSRVRIMNVLAAGEMCVCDLVELLRLPQPTVSRHLGILRASGLVQARRVGRFMHYRLAKPSSGLHATVLRALQRDLDGSPLASERSRAHARIEKRRRSPC